MINDQLNTPLAHMHPWRRLWRHFLRPPGSSFSDCERALEDHGLFTLDGYFAYWAQHNSDVLSIVPSERLLILRTDQISNSLDRIADFVGVPVDTLNSAQSHSFKAPKKHGILKQLDPGFVKEKAEQHCADLMKQFFPEIDGPPHATKNPIPLKRIISSEDENVSTEQTEHQRQIRAAIEKIFSPL